MSFWGLASVLRPCITSLRMQNRAFFFPDSGSIAAFPLTCKHNKYYVQLIIHRNDTIPPPRPRNSITMPITQDEDGRRTSPTWEFSGFMAGQVYDYYTRAHVNEQLRRRYELSMGEDWRPPSTGQPTREGVPTLVPRTVQNPQGFNPATDRRDIPPTEPNIRTKPPTNSR